MEQIALDFKKVELCFTWHAILRLQLFWQNSQNAFGSTAEL